MPPRLVKSAVGLAALTQDIASNADSPAKRINKEAATAGDLCIPP